MASLLKNLLGNGSNDRELSEVVRAALQEFRQERKAYETLLERSQTSTERLQDMVVPIAKAGSDLDSVTERLSGLEERMASMTKLASLFENLDERAEALAESQKRAETQIGSVNDNSQHIRTVMEELATKAELAVTLKEQLSAFLEVEKPFQQLRTEADALRGQVEGTGDHVARLREQHERLLDANKTAMSKMEALDRRRDDLGRSLSDKERRLVGVENAVQSMDGIQTTVDTFRRDMQTLKAMSDLVAQKIAALEAQRETVDRALSQAEQLDQSMRQLDARVQQQRDNEHALKVLQEQVGAVRGLHESVLERSNSISQLQREIDERTQATRQDLAAVTDETRKTVERFDFERRGLESVTQRVADLRASLADCETRFKPLGEASLTVNDLRNHTQTLTTHLQGLGADTARIDEEMAKLHTLRRELEETARTANTTAEQVGRIEQAQPALDAGLRDLEQLRGAHAAVKDALEHAGMAHAEIDRMVDAQSQTRTWLAGIERSYDEMKDQAATLQSMAPTLEFVESQTRRIGDAMSSIESRREFIEEVHRRMGDLESLSGHLEERGRELQTRMEAAEKRFLGLSSHAEDAERMTMTLAGVTTGLHEAENTASEIRKTVAAIATRAESVEGLAEKTRALRQELEQRQKALAEATRELQRTTELREEASASAQQLDDTSRQLATALAATDQHVTRVTKLSAQLEDRAVGLRSVESRLARFEEKIASWDRVDENVSRSLEEIASRQETVGALQADLDRMFAMAEKTTAHIREISAANHEIEGSRELLESVSAQLQEVRATASSIDERKRQLAKAEERLARTEGLLADVRSSLEGLQGQKALVDQAVERAGTLQFLLKQADAVIEGLRDERKTSERVRSAMTLVERDTDVGDDEDIANAA